MLKLLVRPLYGNEPAYGIRELVQNALDAVQELWALRAKHPDLKVPQQIEQDADVEVWLSDQDETGHALLTVSDRGVGMTVDVIKNYYLKASASFRYSDEWRKEFETDPPESEGGSRVRSRVPRSGRFGIGVLAAFLLGDEIEVATKHVLAEKGIRFRTSLSSGPISLDFDNDDSLAVGTTVKVRVDRETYQKLIQDQYEEDEDLDDLDDLDEEDEDLDDLDVDDLKGPDKALPQSKAPVKALSGPETPENVPPLLYKLHIRSKLIA